MSENKKIDPVEEQKRRQKELVELKLKKQQFESNPDEFVPEGGAPEVVLDTKGKIVNFWYYAKKSIAFFLVLAIILVIGVTQCASRTEYDMTIVLYMKRSISSTMVENLATVAERYCEDTNGDGEVHVLILDCAATDEEKKGDTGMGKATRLQASFSNQEAIVYIMDEDAFLELSALDEGEFISNQLKLPLFEGRCFQLNGTIFDDAFNTADPDYADSFNYYIARRVIAGTQIEKFKDVAEFSKQADEFIKAVINDPELFKDGEKPQNEVPEPEEKEEPKEAPLPENKEEPKE